MTLPLTIFLPQFYSSELGMNMALVGFVFSLIRIGDLFLDPLIGSLIDRTRTRFGSHKPWLVAGLPVMMLGSYLLFMAQPGATPGYLFVALVVTYVGYSMVTLAQMGLASAVTQRYEERSSVFAWWQLFNMTGVVLVLVGPSIYHHIVPDAQMMNVAAMGWLVLLMAPATILLSLLAKRLETAQQKARYRSIRLVNFIELMKLRSARLLLGSVMATQLAIATSAAVFVFFYSEIKGIDAGNFTFLLAMSFTIMIFMGPVWAQIGNKNGKHRALALGCFLLGGLMLFVLLMPRGSVAYMFVVMVFNGLINSAFDVLPRAMMADVADEDRLISGRDRTGALFALLAMMYKFGQAVAIGIVFFFLDMLNFDPAAGVSNSALALNSVSFAYCVAPAIMLFAAGYIVSRYPLTAARHDEIRGQLADSDPQAAALPG